MPGGELNQIKEGVREVTLIGKFLSSNLHASRNALIDALKHNAYPKDENGWQPVRFRYTGAETWKNEEVRPHLNF